MTCKECSIHEAVSCICLACRGRCVHCIRKSKHDAASTVAEKYANMSADVAESALAFIAELGRLLSQGNGVALLPQHPEHLMIIDFALLGAERVLHEKVS